MQLARHTHMLEVWRDLPIDQLLAGDYLAHVDLSGDVRRLGLDDADGWPRYYFISIASSSSARRGSPSASSLPLTDQPKEAPIDRITTSLLFAIALGLWANLGALLWTVHAQNVDVAASSAPCATSTAASA